MKRITLFSKLLNILYVILIIGISLLLCSIVILSFMSDKLHLKTINGINISSSYIGFFSTLVIMMTLYFYSIKTLYYLRKVSKSLLHNRYFSNSIILNLRKSGTSSIILALIITGYDIYNSLVRLYYKISPLKVNENILLPSLLIVIGLFFFIQSEILLKARNMEKENRLTI